MSSTSSFSTPSLAAMLLAGAVLLLLLGLGVATDDVQELDDATVFAVEEGEEESEVANAEEGEDEEKEQWSDWLLFEEFDEEMDMDMDSEADVEFLSEEEDEGASISTSKVPTVPGQRILTKYEMAEKNTFQHKGKERLPEKLLKDLNDAEIKKIGSSDIKGVKKDYNVALSKNKSESRKNSRSKLKATVNPMLRGQKRAEKMTDLSENANNLKIERNRLKKNSREHRNEVKNLYNKAIEEAPVAPGAKRVAPLEVAPDTVKGRVTLAHLGGAAHVRQVMETANPNSIKKNQEIRNEFVGNNPGLTKDALEMKRDQDLRRVDKEAKDYAKINEGLVDRKTYDQVANALKPTIHLGKKLEKHRDLRDQKKRIRDNARESEEMTFGTERTRVREFYNEQIANAPENPYANGKMAFDTNMAIRFNDE